MSDIRKFMNIVESVSEDAMSQDVGTTDIESNDGQPSKMSNRDKANIALHYLIELDRFIRYARFSSENLSKPERQGRKYRIFISRADHFITEAKNIIEKISKKPYEGPNEIEDIEIATVVTPYDPNIFRDRGRYTAANYGQVYIDHALAVIEHGIDLIERPDGLLRMTQNLVITNNKFRDLTNSWERGRSKLEHSLKLISNP